MFQTSYNCASPATAWCVTYNGLEDVTGHLMLAHPLKVVASAEAKVKTDKIDATIRGKTKRFRVARSTTMGSGVG